MEFPPYELDENLHADHSRLARTMDANPRLRKVADLGEFPDVKLVKSWVRVGDLITIRIVNSAHHLAGVIQGDKRLVLLQAVRWPVEKVIQTDLDDSTFAKRYLAIYRPIK